MQGPWLSDTRTETINSVTSEATDIISTVSMFYDHLNTQ